MIPRLHLKIVSRFKDVFGHKGNVKLYFAPGRLTLIGEHIDYSGGDTITMAVDRGTYLAVRKRSDNKINIYSHTFKEKKSFTLDKLEKEHRDEWALYFKGVLDAFIKGSYNISGLDIFAHTDIPFHTSLASSSSLCACLTFAVDNLNNLKIDWSEKSLISHKGETTYASQKTSVSDHIAIFVAEAGMFTYFNLSKMKYENIPFDMQDYSIAVVNSNKKRMSSDSEYNARKRECDNALKKLKEKKPNLVSLCSLKNKDIAFVKSVLTNKEQRRALYAIGEKERVVQALKAIRKNSVKNLANLIVKTHEGLSTLYEVSTAELDILVEEAMKIDGVLGARMIGTGFGGGVLMFFKKEEVENIVETLYTHYKERTRKDADVYILKSSGGARVLQID